VDGVSLVPLLKGKAIEKRPLYWHYPHYGNQGGEPSSIIMEDDWKLIYYHEDNRNELYNIKNDIGEQNDLIKKENKRAQRMRKKLDAWLKQTKAKFPTPDPQFNSAKRDARWEQIKKSGKAGLEKKHASYLDPNYIPNKDWWGSSVD
jgi:arylsulfatase A-like enzyme